ncbi:MAG: holo-ACP synthase [Thermoguttaceae bacterium]|nr:holo-ACP synthase [Thermoguttaceae bacterium]
MRVVGIGTDITEIERVERMMKKHGDFFLRRVFTPGEARYCDSGRKSGERYAARWAAKEAVMKALGTGWSEGVDWTEIEVLHDPSGRPSLSLTGGARRRSDELGIAEWQISISHCQLYAIAFVTALAEE